MAAKTTGRRSKGAKERGGSKKGRQRRTPRRVYTREAKQLQFARERFLFRWYDGTRWVDINDIVTGASWEDSEAILKGSLSLTVPDPPEKVLEIRQGNAISCAVDPTGGRKYRPLWTMRVQKPEASAEGTVEVALESELALIQRSKHDFKYRKGGKRRKKGWLAHEIAFDACRKNRVRVDRRRSFPRTRHRIEKLVKQNVSVYEIVKEAFDKEATATGKKFVIEYRNRLMVRTFRYPKHMQVFGETLTAAAVSIALKEGYSTAVTVRGSTGKGKDKKKVNALVVNRRGAGRYGYVHKYVKESNLKSLADARRKGRRLLARALQPKKEVTFSHPGLPFLRRADAIRVELPQMDFQKDAYVTAVTHTLGPGSYDMEVTVNFDDPYVNEKAERADKKKCDAARKRKRKLPKGCPGKPKREEPKKAAQRR